MVRTVLLRLRRLAERLFARALWRLAESQFLGGIRTAVVADAVEAPTCFKRILAALEVIERHDHATWSRIRTHFDGILVQGSQPFLIAYWLDSARLCVITVRYLTSPETTPEHVAMTLVHESMHARLRALGARYDDGRRAHIEVICAMAELAFARNLPNADALRQRTERRITVWATDGEAPWSDAAMRRAGFEHLRGLGVPQWFLALVDRLARLKRRRAA